MSKSVPKSTKNQSLDGLGGIWAQKTLWPASWVPLGLLMGASWAFLDALEGPRELQIDPQRKP